MEEKELAMSSEFMRGAYKLSVDLASGVYMDPETYQQEMARIRVELAQPIFQYALMNIMSDVRFTTELTEKGKVVSPYTLQ